MVGNMTYKDGKIYGNWGYGIYLCKRDDGTLGEYKANIEDYRINLITPLYETSMTYEIVEILEYHGELIMPVEHGLLDTSEKISDHFREIARVINERADDLNLDPKGCISIEIKANISVVDVTTVSFKVDYVADPRTHKGVENG